jgi:hypothetical protein
MPGVSTSLMRCRAIERIYDAVLDHQLLPAAIDAIAEATGSSGGMLGIFDMDNGQGHAPAIAGLDPRLLALFEERYGLNLWTEAMRVHARVACPCRRNRAWTAGHCARPNSMTRSWRRRTSWHSRSRSCGAMAASRSACR